MFATSDGQRTLAPSVEVSIALHMATCRAGSRSQLHPASWTQAGLLLMAPSAAPWQLPASPPVLNCSLVEFLWPFAHGSPPAWQLGCAWPSEVL